MKRRFPSVSWMKYLITWEVCENWWGLLSGLVVVGCHCWRGHCWKVWTGVISVWILTVVWSQAVQSSVSCLPQLIITKLNSSRHLLCHRSLFLYGLHRHSLVLPVDLGNEEIQRKSWLVYRMSMYQRQLSLMSNDDWVLHLTDIKVIKLVTQLDAK